MSDDPLKPASKPESQGAPAGVWEHWCEHEGCKRWGSFGYATRYGQVWFCGEHRHAGEAMPLRGR